MEKRAHDEDGEPSLEQINQGGCDGEPADRQAFEDDACHCQRPDRGKESPSHRPAQRDKGEGRIGSCNEHVDGRVVQDKEEMASAGTHQRVVKRGAEINEHERAGKDGATDDKKRRSAGGGDDEINRSHDGEAEADAVCDGVGEDVAQIGARWHRLMIVRADAKERAGRPRRTGVLRVPNQDLP